MRFKMIHENFNVSDLDVSLAFYILASNDKEISLKNLSIQNGLPEDYMAVNLIKLKQII